ncbi:MAG: hypothetical protein LIO77_04580 [Rikenellaceae bacterium]|nr:hypothetical protein [Rikenellaceae bacterium]
MDTIKKFEDFGSFRAEAAQGRAPGLAIGCVNWPCLFPHKPKVSVVVGHDGRNIFLHYKVSEQYTLARVTENNGPVWTDSCVEFFVSFDPTGYYNFEMTPIGTTLLGFRKERENPTHAPDSIIDSIERVPSLAREPFDEISGGQEWELSVRIPAASFFNHSIADLSGIVARANFYKCGDALTVPHYLSWKPIENHKPDFHLEQFFGDIIFE